MEGFPSVGLIASKLWILNDDLLNEEKKKKKNNPQTRVKVSSDSIKDI